MRAVVYTLGCKVNDVESGSIIRGLEELGYEVGREIEEADLFVINTCAVTREAERKSRQTVGRLFKADNRQFANTFGEVSDCKYTAFSAKLLQNE